MGERLDFIGPIEHHAVVLNGRRVPYLTAAPRNGGETTLTLDDRFGIDLSVSDAQRIVPFIAHCLAVGMGYAGFPDPGTTPTRREPMPPMQAINLDEEGWK